ncbi:hypothetical protein DHODJN_14460 [Methylorubrum extorquens]
MPPRPATERAPSPAMFVEAYRYRRRLKSLRGRKPYEFICRTLAKLRDWIRLDPAHSMPGPDIQRGFSGAAPCPAVTEC